MKDRRGSVARSPREWIIRGTLAALAAVLGYFSVTFSLAQSVMAGDPALAYQLAPYEGRITARLASSLIDEGADAKIQDRADRLARAALRTEPTAVVAVSTLGLNAQLRLDTQAARRFFAYAQTLSRRDPKTQLWAIEDAVARNDIPDALRQYDITLRTRPQLVSLLYPILASASADPAIRGELVRTLGAKPRWSDSFVTYAARAGTDPASAAQLFVALQQARVALPAGAQATVVNRLLNANRLDEAWRYYALIRPKADRAQSRDPGFSTSGENPTMLDWTPINTDGMVAYTQDNAFHFTVPASVGGPVLQQMQLLPPSIYRLAGQSVGIDDDERARPYWALRCGAGGRELGRVVLPNSAENRGRFSGEFSVPADCPSQALVLVARPTDKLGGYDAQLQQVELVPAR